MTDMLTITDVNQLKDWRHSQLNHPVAVVMTMGALHDGHVALIRTARAHLDTHYGGEGTVVVTIFVNPTQFNNGADYEQYPQSFESDLQTCEQHGVDLVFSPSVNQMYPEGIENASLLNPSEAADVLDGPLRPGHFNGVVTVVSRLFDLVQPTVALFGEKDYQQLVIIQDLVRTQHRNIEIVPVPTVRESDAVAFSSRNKRLTLTGRALAKHIPATFALVKHAISEGKSLADALDAGVQYIGNQPGIDLEYLEIRSQKLEPVTSPGIARIFIAAKILGVRLIDNDTIEIGVENVASN